MIKPPQETDAQFRAFFTSNGFRVVRTFGEAINTGSPHTYGGAADVSIQGKSVNEIFNLAVKALQKGYRWFDERVPAAGVKQTGPHIHVENAKTTLTKPSRFLAASYYGGEANLQTLKNLEAVRMGKAASSSVIDSADVPAILNNTATASGGSSSLTNIMIAAAVGIVLISIIRD
jgi:hypothetical protein